MTSKRVEDRAMLKQVMQQNFKASLMNTTHTLTGGSYTSASTSVVSTHTDPHDGSSSDIKDNQGPAFLKP